MSESNGPSVAMSVGNRTISASHLAVVAGLIALQAAILVGMGLPIICRCGYIALWHGNPSGPETSQHIVDWYTYTHAIHGILLYALLWLVAPRSSIGIRFVLAMLIEAGWEVLENTPFIMDRYRQTALAHGYAGDSAINSAADTIAAAAGFLLCRILSIRTIAALVVATELFAAVMIRDGLALNIVQLIHPNEALNQWQNRR